MITARARAARWRSPPESDGGSAPADGDLSHWARSGVLLLNTVLTVPAGDAGGHRGLGWEALAAERGVHGVLVLVQRAGLDRRNDLLLVFEGRQQHHLSCRTLDSNFPNRGDAAAWHDQIDQRHVRLLAIAQCDGAGGIAGLTDDGNIGIGFQKPAYAVSDQFVVVCDDDAKRNVGHGEGRAVTRMRTPPVSVDCSANSPPGSEHARSRMFTRPIPGMAVGLMPRPSSVISSTSSP